ncbi:MAG: SPASM domain-containing protein [Candidatus Brocadia sp.]|nr:SPASM domain-containing protein [Candidatus Brocadia sp.]
MAKKLKICHNQTTCCANYQGKGIIGDLKENTLAEIWQGNILQKLRRAHLEGRYDEVPLCSKCDFWRCEVNIEKWLRCKIMHGNLI